MPRTSDKPLKSSTNAKVQIYLWLGTEDQEQHIFKQLPPGFDMPTLPLTAGLKLVQYNGSFLEPIATRDGGLLFSERSLYELRCHCYKARSLIASDETGLSDPYLSITVGNETQTTPVILSLTFDRDERSSSGLDSQRIVVSSMECDIALSESRSCWQSTHRRRNHRQCRRRMLRLRSGLRRRSTIATNF